MVYSGGVVIHGSLSRRFCSGSTTTLSCKLVEQQLSVVCAGSFNHLSGTFGSLSWRFGSFQWFEWGVVVTKLSIMFWDVWLFLVI